MDRLPSAATFGNDAPKVEVRHILVNIPALCDEFTKFHDGVTLCNKGSFHLVAAFYIAQLVLGVALSIAGTWVLGF